jgi:hypothetical protein
MRRWRSTLMMPGLITQGALRLALTLGCCGALPGLVVIDLAVSSTARAQAHARQAVAAEISVDWRGDRLSVRMRHAPWDQVLPELERHTSVRMHAGAPLVGTVTQEFVDLPLEQGLRRLFREMNTVFFFASGPLADAPSGTVTQVWLWPRENQAVEEQPRQPSPHGITPAPGGEERPLGGETEAGGIRVEAAAPAEESAAATELEASHQALHAVAQQEAVAEACQHAPALRVHALRRLYDAGLVDERTAVSDLCEGLQSDSSGDKD